MFLDLDLIIKLGELLEHRSNITHPLPNRWGCPSSCQILKVPCSRLAITVDIGHSVGALSTNDHLGVVLEVVHLNGSVSEMHDDCFWSPDPPLYLWNGNGHGSGAGLHTPISSLTPLCQVLIHVLGEVSEQGELFVEGGGDMLGGHGAHTAALSELDVASIKRVTDPGVVIEQDSNRSI